MDQQVKLRIDVASGILELEAPLQAVDGLLERLQTFLPALREVQPTELPQPQSQSGGAPAPAPASSAPRPPAAGQPEAPIKRPARAARKESAELRVLPDLNLRPDGKQSLREFYESKAPGSNERAFAVIVYYYKKILLVEAVTVNHIYTALKDLGMKVPTRLPTVLSNSVRRHGWIDTRDTDSITITIHGENFVEHDLPPKKATSAKS